MFHNNVTYSGVIWHIPEFLRMFRSKPPSQLKPPPPVYYLVGRRHYLRTGYYPCVTLYVKKREEGDIFFTTL